MCFTDFKKKDDFEDMLSVLKKSVKTEILIYMINLQRAIWNPKKEAGHLCIYYIEV